ncbi:MAG TPA: MAPEG family protein [Steroidobacteraceae bacterium]|nr:MAPEG family protein [Steroidobacteraceae bacterium]
MPYVALVTLLALTQYFWFSVRVMRARGKYGVAAPAITGHEIFERHFRVHMNTQEQLLLLLPSLWMFARFISPIWAAALGLIYVIGREVYARSYVQDPKRRELGFVISITPIAVMMAGIAIWAIRAILVTASVS